MNNQYLYIEASGTCGVFDRAPGDNAWTDESDWQEIADGSLHVFRITPNGFEKLDGDGSWTAVPGWYRT